MDWTGGTRRRYAAGKANPLLQKQRAHFTKARATMQYAPVSSTASKKSFATVIDAFANGARTPTTEEHQCRHPGSRKAECGLSRPLAHGKAAINTDRGPPSTAVKPPRSQDRTISIKSDMALSEVMQEGLRKDVARPARNSDALRDEELLLLANRRRLLARSDWLRLGPTKPLRMKFPASRDRDQIGKRRKISKSGSQKARPARQRLVTPLFEERLKPVEHLVSGALPNDETHEAIQVRIGIDAFASQSYHPRHSHTLRDLSARRSSTEFDLISEETMLLGADGDVFDANMVVIPADASELRAKKSTVTSVLAYHGSQTLDTGSGDQNYQHDNFEQHNDHRFLAGFARHDHGRVMSIDHEWPQQQIDQNDPHYEHELDIASAGHLQLGQEVEQLQREPAESVSHTPCSQMSDPGLGSEWERFLGVSSHTDRNTSTVALDSSSLHVITSGSVQRRPQDPIINGNHNEIEMSTPKGAGTQASFLRQPPPGMNITDTIPDSSDESPSASLEQIIGLAQLSDTKQRVQPPTGNREYPDDDDELWRQFIIGSRSSDCSGDEDFDLGKRFRAKPQLSTKLPSSLTDVPAKNSISGTHGTSLFVTSMTPSLFNVDCRHQNKTVEAKRTDGTSVPVELKNVEAVTPSPVASRSRINIHAEVATHLNPKRFKKPTKQSQLKPAAKFTQDSVSRASEKLRTAQHSVYDLVDSDGVSLNS